MKYNVIPELCITNGYTPLRPLEALEERVGGGGGKWSNFSTFHLISRKKIYNFFGWGILDIFS